MGRLITKVKIKEGFLAFTAGLQEAGYSCVLNDVRLVVGPVRTLAWGVEEWSPTAAAAGLKYLALMPSKDAVAADSVTEYDVRRNYFQTEVFYNVEDAKSWMSQFCLQGA